MNFKLLKYIRDGHERSVRTKTNIIYSFLFKSGSILCSLLTIPILLGYLNPTRFGIWLTVSSIVTWIGLLDIGLGNGLRNKLAEVLAIGDIDQAKSYVSTAYAAIAAIVVVIMILFFGINSFLSWSTILNTTPGFENELSMLVSFMVVFFSLKFVTSLINTILTATQNMGASSSIDFIISLVSLLEVALLSKTAYNSLLITGIILSFTNFFIPLIASIWFFKTKYKNLAPSFDLVNLSHLKDLSSVGIQFFFIQIAVVIIFSTGNIIIIQLLNAEEVTKYNIVFKYFSIVPIGFAIIITPFWSAFTEAYQKNDILWIRSSTEKLIKLWVLITIGVIGMVFISDSVYLHWIGKDLGIPISLSAGLGVFVVISTWNNIYVYFINGIGKIRLQLYLSSSVALLNIPLSIYLVKQLGTLGVVFSSIVCLIPAAIMMPIQYKKLIEKKAKGLYNI